MSEAIRPKALTKGATIGVVSPSYWLDEVMLAKAVDYLQQQDFQVVLGDSVTQRDGIVAGSAESRAMDIMRMFQDPQVDAIICARGGYGANRVLPLLDYELIKQHSKIFIGFSDITALLNSFAQKSDMVAFHGPMLSNFAKQDIPYNFSQLTGILSGELDLVESPLECQAISLQQGKATGVLCGGNLSLIVERLGTNDQIDTNNKILLIEEVGEKLYRFDRMMMQLQNSGSLDRVAGLIFGEMTEMSDTATPFGRTIEEIILATCQSVSGPIIFNFAAGHGDYIATLPIGHPVTVVAEEQYNYIKITESPVVR